MKKYQKFLAAALALCSVSTAAKAASYQLNDYSVTNLGRSYAGVGIVGDDYSAIAYNPAGMTLKKKSGVQQVFNLIGVKSDVREINGPGKAEMQFWQPIPAGFAQYNVNDSFFVGGGIYAPFGLKTKYKSDWFGSDSAILSKLDIVDFNLSMAYKLDNHWSIGASAILRYIYGRMTQTVPSAIGGGDINFNVHGWSQTGSLGLIYEVDEATRFGVSYRLRSAQRAKGKFKTSNPILLGMMAGNDTVNANPDLPETVTFSAYHRIKNVGFSGTARWTHWTSSFPDFSIRSAGIPGGEKKSLYDYQNTWGLALGADYYYDKEVTLRAGVGYDESPTHKPERRSYRIPDSDRWWMSAGASYVKDNWQFDAAYALLLAKSSRSTPEATANQPVTVRYKNTYSNIFGLQVQYSF